MSVPLAATQDESCLPGILLLRQKQGSPHRCRGWEWGLRRAEGHVIWSLWLSVPSLPHLEHRWAGVCWWGGRLKMLLFGKEVVKMVLLQIQPVILGDLGDLWDIEHRNRRIIP